MMTEDFGTKRSARRVSPFGEALFSPAIDHDYSENYLLWGRVAEPPL